ncbi:MAG: ankyrin repeat domain-containing protein [Acidobacteriota bacterium]
MRARLLESLGGEAGCERLSAAFYGRVKNDAVLRPLFPGKSLRCATEEFAAFLIQFLGGDEERTQHRWWVSLRESHARFEISAAQRSAWLKHMGATLEAAEMGEEARAALRQFFVQSSAYVVGKEAAAVEDGELAACWGEQRVLDELIGAIGAGRDEEAVAEAARFAARPVVFVGVLVRMMQTGRAGLVRFVMEAVERDASLGARRYGGRPLLHYASEAGCLEVVELVLRQGVDANLLDRGGHRPLYAVANGCGTEAGPVVVRALVGAGADVDACGGVTRATALHMAARRGHVEIARALLDSGAAMDARDSKGDTPLQRAINCRKGAVAAVLRERGARR